MSLTSDMAIGGGSLRSVDSNGMSQHFTCIYLNMIMNPFTVPVRPCMGALEINRGS